MLSLLSVIILQRRLHFCPSLNIALSLSACLQLVKPSQLKTSELDVVLGICLTFQESKKKIYICDNLKMNTLILVIFSFGFEAPFFLFLWKLIFISTVFAVYIKNKINITIIITLLISCSNDIMNTCSVQNTAKEIIALIVFFHQ
jgi:hypothetical protein